MTETVSLFFYVLTLLFSFYTEAATVLAAGNCPDMSVLVISFRMSYLLVVLISAVSLPLIAFFPEIRAAFRNHSSTLFKVSRLKPAGLHLVFSILLMFFLQQGYRQLNGRLAGHGPHLHASGLTLLATWAPALKPTDSPDPRLSALNCRGGQFGLGNITRRNAQLYMPGYLVDRWKQIEPNAAIQNQVAKQTALHALLRRPIGVATLGAKTFLGYWDFSQMRRSAKSDLETTFPWERQISRVATHFRLSPPERRDTKVRTLLQRYQVRAQPYY